MEVSEILKQKPKYSNIDFSKKSMTQTSDSCLAVKEYNKETYLQSFYLFID
jgi:hypothetical protein